MTLTAETTRLPTAENPNPGGSPSGPQPTPGTASANDAAPHAGGELMERVVQGAHQAIDRLAEQAAPHVQRLEEKLGNADDMLHQRADQWREMGDVYVGSLRDTVRENPLLALGAALALGLIIARVTR